MMSGRPPARPQFGPSSTTNLLTQRHPQQQQVQFSTGPPHAARPGPPPSARTGSAQPAAPPASSSSTHPNPSRLNPPKLQTQDLARSVTSSSHPPSLSDKYSLSHSPQDWGAPLLNGEPEPDDGLHTPDPRRDRKSDKGGTIFTARGISNIGCLLILALGCLMLFAGYPILSHFTKEEPTKQSGFNLGGINGSGQIPEIPGNYGLIDKDTPASALTKRSYMENEDLELVFSDEFNRDGRTFYPGDDPFWEAVDLHYWGTDNLEWYDPMQATTKDGYLQLRMDQVDKPSDNHDMLYRSAMIQTWNKFCFTGGLVEASVRLPGSFSTSGLWPAIWTMGNLGRAGFGASVDGLWPFSYDACDVGTLPNQTWPGTRSPEAAVTTGPANRARSLSYSPGQRLSACTCPGEEHPGPMRRDGSFVGRAAPELDVLEATVANGAGEVSLSAQWAPFNAAYTVDYANTSKAVFYGDTAANAFRGGVYQMTTSGLAPTNRNCYELDGTGCFALYGFEYKPGFDNGYITWINEVQSWTMFSALLEPDPLVELTAARPIPLEPMYLIANLGISEGFGVIDTANLKFPTTMLVDYIRVYQRRGQRNVGCDPKDFPTEAYINAHMPVYTNPNLSTWDQYVQTSGTKWPRNRLMEPGRTC